MERIVRCQTVVFQNHQILLLRHANYQRGITYWWLPGGGLEEGETYAQAAIRETHEDTGLIVRAERLLFEMEDVQRKNHYQKYLTFRAITNLIISSWTGDIRTINWGSDFSTVTHKPKKPRM